MNKEAFARWISFEGRPSMTADQVAKIPTPRHVIRTRTLAREVSKANSVPYTEALHEIMVRQKGRADGFFPRIRILEPFGERVAYVGDIHGGNDAFYKRLERMADNPPDLLILSGDIAGSLDYEELQRRFYNTLVNHTKPFLKENPSDEELLSYRDVVGEDPLTHQKVHTDTMKEGFLGLRKKELSVAGKSPEEIESMMQSLDDATIASEIRRYSKYVHFGHYVSNLPEEVVKNLVAQLDEGVQTFVNAVRPLHEKGTQIIINRGNWDSATPTDFERGTEKPVRLPENERPFRVWDAIHAKDAALTMIDGPVSVERSKRSRSLHVVVPFDSLVGLVGKDGQVREDDLQNKFGELKQKVDRARKKGKAVILVTHGQPDWEMHYLNYRSQPEEKRPQPNAENKAVIAGTKRLVAYVGPDELVYGHMHEQKDENGDDIAPHVRYVLQVTKDGRSVDVVQSPEEFSKGDVVASLTPLQEIARSYIPAKRRLRGISLNGKNKGRKAAIIERE